MDAVSTALDSREGLAVEGISGSRDSFAPLTAGRGQDGWAYRSVCTRCASCCGVCQRMRYPWLFGGQSLLVSAGGGRVERTHLGLGRLLQQVSRRDETGFERRYILFALSMWLLYGLS